MGQVTISGQTFDIYGEHIADDAGPPVVQSAKNYFLAATHASAFTGAGTSDQAKALVTATRMLDRQVWQGTRTDLVTPQPLAWPRTGITAKEGDPPDDDTIPTRVIQACYELANALLADAAVQTSPSQGTNTKRTRTRDKVGDLETEAETEYFRPGSSDGSGGATRFPTIIHELIGCWLESGSDLALVFASGTEVGTVFDGELDNFGFTDPGLP